MKKNKCMSSNKQIKIVCSECGSDDVLVDAWVRWDYVSQQYVIHDILDDSFCNNCEGECKTKEITTEV